MSVWVTDRLRRAILAKYLNNVASGMPYDAYHSHDLSKVKTPEDHSLAIIEKDGMPYCECLCGYICDLKPDGSGIIIHQDKKINP